MNTGLRMMHLLALFSWLWIPVSYAETVTISSQSLELTMPLQPTVPKDKTDTLSAEAQQDKQLREQANNRSIVSGKRLALTEELKPIKQTIDALLNDPRNLSVLKQLQQQPQLLQSYIERQFYNNTDSLLQRTYIELFALVLGNEAIKPLLEWGHTLKESHQLQSIISALRYLKPTPEIREFIDTLLDKELQHQDVVKSALFYHAVWTDTSAMRWVIQYRNTHIAEDIRYIALYLGAQLGNAELLPKIVERLETHPPMYQRYYLHLALSHIVGEREYKQLTRNMLLEDAALQSIQRQIQFRRAADEVRNTLLDAMLASYYFEERQLAFEHLLQQPDQSRLQALLVGSQALEVYRRAQQAGIDLALPQDPVSDDDEIRPPPLDAESANGWWYAISILFMMLLVVFLLKRRTGSTGIHPV